MVTTDLDETQQELQSVVRSFLTTVSVRDILEGRIDSKDVWKRLAKELQLFELAVPPSPGDDDAPGLPELLIFFEELGRALTPGPYLSTLALGLPTLWLSGDDRASRRLIDRVVTGDAVVAVLSQDGDLSVEDNPGGLRVTGVAERVMDAPAADVLIAPVRSSAGISFVLVNVNGPGVKITDEEPFDPTMRFGRVELSGAPAARLGADADGSALLERVETRARVALAGFHVGLARACVEKASAYALVRHQFDRPIGSFQSIKHLLADIHRRTEAAAILARRAAWVADHEPQHAALIAHLAAAEAADAAFEAAASNIQIHGGIGFTWEHDAHLYFKRATAGRFLLGTPQEHRDAVADVLLREGVVA